MRRPSQVVVQAGPVLPRDAAPGRTRSLVLGTRTWELRPPGEGAGDVWTWRRAGRFSRTWSLESALGTHLVLHALDFFGRRFRAESAGGGWTLRCGFLGGVTATDDAGTVVWRFHPGWLWGGRCEPASGPDLRWRHRWLRGYRLETGEALALFTLVGSGGLLSRGYRLTLTEAALAREDLLPLAALAMVAALTLARSRSHGGH